MTNVAIRCEKDDFVEIHYVILTAAERSKDVPGDTRKVPLEAWIKGRALGSAGLGEEVLIETAAGRKVEGKLTRINPGYAHTYGPSVPELAPISKELRSMLKGGANRE